jgi:mRNA interferase RelE/StbE
MNYQVTFAASALQEFRALSWDIKNRLRLSVDGLRENPRPPGVRKIQGRENLYGLRIGSYRLVYEIDDQKRKIRVIRVRHRRDAYR